MIEYTDTTPINEINKKWLDDRLVYPETEYSILSKENIKNIKKENYYISHFIDGEHMSLGCIKHDNRNYVILFNKNFKIYLVKANTSTELLQGTLINGIFKNNILYIYDIQLFSGKNISLEAYEKRIEYLNEINKNMILHDIKVQIVEQYPLSKVEYFIDKDYNYNHDGFIFIPNTKTSLDIKDRYILKHYNPDFIITFSVDNRYNLFVLEKEKMIKTRNKLSIIPDYVKNISENETILIKCTLDNINSKLWKPIEISNEEVPSRNYDLKKYLKDIKNVITINDIIDI